MKYPATFTPDPDGGYVVTFRDIPEAIAQGDDEAEALAEARSALATAMDFYFEDRRAAPAPSAALPGERLISLPASVSAKVLLLNEMAAQDMRPAELARRLGVKPQEVTRLLDLAHTTKIDAIEEAMHALGRELEVVAA
jgi:antitoxin HicB